MSDTTLTSPAPPAKKKRRARNSKTKICKTCNQDILANEMRGMFMSHDTYHQLRAKDHCKEHEFKYNDHKCKPIWCDECRYLMKYEIQIKLDE